MGGPNKLGGKGGSEKKFCSLILWFDLLTRDFNFSTGAFSLLTRGFELVTRGFQLLTREFELVIRGFNSQLVNLNS